MNSSAATAEERLSQLQEHSDFISRLAYALVRDASTADDLIQETWVAALKDRAPLRSPRAWFATLLRNIARQQHRSDRRRRRREASRIDERQPEQPDEISERFDTSRRLAEQVSRLEDPYRRTVLQHYFDGISLADIARQEDVPSATVRWRLRRALEQLRALLDAEHDGERRTWCLAMVPLAIRGSKRARFGASLLAAAGLVICVGGAGVWGFGLWNGGTAPGQPEPESEQKVAQAPADVESARQDPAPIVPGPDSSESSASLGESTAEAPPIESAEPEAPIGRSAGIDGVFVDSQGEPIAGVRLTPTDLGSGPFVQMLVNNLFPDRPSATDGTFQIDVSVGPGVMKRIASLTGASIDSRVSLGFRAEHEDFEATDFTLILVDGERTDFGRKMLFRPTHVEGRVVGEDGLPIAGAKVAITTPPFPASRASARSSGPRYAEFRGGTDAEGRFRVIAPRGLVRVWAGSDRHSYGWRHARVEEGGVVDIGNLKLELRPTEEESGNYSLFGVVLTPTGEPVPNASLSMRSSASNITMFADDRGEFVLPCIDRENEADPVSIWAVDQARRWGTRVVTWDDPVEGTRLEVILNEPESIRIQVNGPTPAELEQAQVTWEARGWPVFGKRVPGTADVFEIERPVLGLPVHIKVEGYVGAKIEAVAGEPFPDESQIQLYPRRGVSGQILSDGEPVVGADLILHRVGPGLRGLVNGFFTQYSPRWGRFDRQTDADGRFELYPEEAGRYVVLAVADGYASTLSEEIEFRFEEAPEPVTLTLTQGGVVEGRVTALDSATPIIGTVVGLNSFDGRPRTVRVGADGRFRFDNLRPGGWTISIRQEVVDPSSGTTSVLPHLVAPEPNIWVEDGRVEEVVIAIDRVRIEGQVVGIEDLLGWSWRLQDPRNRDVLAEGFFEAEGTWEAALAFAQPVELEIRAPGGEFGNFSWKTTRAAEEGSHSWRIDLSVGPLVGRVTNLQEVRGRLELSGRAADGDVVVVVDLDAEGRFSVPFAPTSGVALHSRFWSKSGSRSEAVAWTPETP